jgi:hypothetical protein
MTDREQEIKEIATQLLAGMLANPHLYTMVSDEESKGQQEQLLLSNAIMMAESLVEKIKRAHGAQRGSL